VDRGAPRGTHACANDIVSLVSADWRWDMERISILADTHMNVVLLRGMATPYRHVLHLYLSTSLL
jgi:hypothetical protein